MENNFQIGSTKIHKDQHIFNFAWYVIIVLHILITITHLSTVHWWCHFIQLNWVQNDVIHLIKKKGWWGGCLVVSAAGKMVSE